MKLRPCESLDLEFWGALYIETERSIWRNHWTAENIHHERMYNKLVVVVLLMAEILHQMIW